jgi:hypothetical protein
MGVQLNRCLLAIYLKHYQLGKSAFCDTLAAQILEYFTILLPLDH